ncbi:MAG: DUF424 family protein [Nanoarchaeota archaeon]|nr:DUF424 family protein [Nanoarchaeota archaeon]
MYVNIIDSYRKVVAIADKELVGQIFEKEEKQLNLKENFYKGEDGKIFSEEEVKEIIKKWAIEDATFNIVGERAVKLALDLKIINEKGIKKIQNIPYSLILL